LQILKKSECGGRQIHFFCLEQAREKRSPFKGERVQVASIHLPAAGTQQPVVLWGFEFTISVAFQRGKRTVLGDWTATCFGH